MEKKTVKRWIFLSNTWMILIILLCFLAINVVAVKVYAETIEHEFQNSMARVVDDKALEALVEEYTIHKHEFFMLVLADGVLCISTLIFVSQLFARKLVDHITVPLRALEEGAERIRNRDLTCEVSYQGDREFEDVCGSFNQMQRTLLEEQRKNEKYEQARTDMIAGISHDLRTPLTAVRGTIKGLLDGVASTPEMQKRFLTTAYRRTGEMDLLLKQLFYLSRLETGNMLLEPKRIELGQYLHKYSAEREELYREEPLEILFDDDRSDAAVFVDPGQLSRILDNLLENSRKYAQVDHLIIRIAIQKIQTGIRVRFADNGAGVPEEKLPYVFEEFYRGDESRNIREGSGLGLYIVKCLVEAMGGSVTAENDGGFCVTMMFPEAQ